MANKTWFLPDMVVKIKQDSPFQLIQERNYEYNQPNVWIPINPNNAYIDDDRLIDKYTNIEKIITMSDEDVYAPKGTIVPTKPLTTIASNLKQPQQQPYVPNKVAASDPRWNNKVAWKSEDLAERQKTLETYSCEVAMMFEAVRQIAAKALNRAMTNADLGFYANFGSPVFDNTQKISITLERPIQLKIMLIRRLINEKLEWTCDVGVTENTPINVTARLFDAQKGGPVPMESIVTGLETVDDSPRMRKVRL